MSIEPIPTLLARSRAELSAEFNFNRPIRASRAPRSIDVMGGVAAYTGSLVCHGTLDRGAAVIVQPRSDREIQIFSFDRFDEHQPFTIRMPLDRLARCSADQLRAEFTQPANRWAADLLGGLFLLHQEKILDLASPAMSGINLAILSTSGSHGAGDSSAVVATLLNLIEHFGLRGDFDPLRLAELSHQVQSKIGGTESNLIGSLASCYGQIGSLLRMRCQPATLEPPLIVPHGFRFVAIETGASHDARRRNEHSRCAAFMAHAMILESMRQMGRAAGRTLSADPMGGYLANLDPDDYKKFFRSYLPETIRGSDFISRLGSTIDPRTVVQPDENYPVQHAADHHVLEARRVRQFCEFLEHASALDPADPARFSLMDKAGHLMYASHLSYSNDAMLGAEECDTLVDLVHANEKAGLYGARITGDGCGGSIVVLCEATDRADEAIEQIAAEYAERTLRIKPVSLPLCAGTGAWHTGTTLSGQIV